MTFRAVVEQHDGPAGRQFSTTMQLTGTRKKCGIESGPLSYFPDTRFNRLHLQVNLLISPIKLLTMKDFFAKTYRGHQFEFTRVLSTSFDPWYHISVILDDANVKFRMHSNKEGTWKITIARLPRLLYALEAEFAEHIQLNEKPADPNRFRHD